MTAGYSGTPLIKKLGIKPGFRVSFLNAPQAYADLLGPLPDDVSVVGARARQVNFVHLFSDSARELRSRVPGQRGRLVPNGMIWVSWPKRASGVPTDVTEDVVRAVAFDAGLVDVKVCAVDEVWSGLKLVIPIKDR